MTILAHDREWWIRLFGKARGVKQRIGVPV
jgi:hypothetical protein